MKLMNYFNVIIRSYASQVTLKSIKKSSQMICVNGDIVGPPNPLSNLRPITFYVPRNESELEREYRIKRENVQRWNQEFWTEHNAKFQKERTDYIEQHKGNNETLNADEMSLFYKSFLDKYWNIHLYYNREWYKRNTELSILAFKVLLSKFQHKFIFNKLFLK